MSVDTSSFVHLSPSSKEVLRFESMRSFDLKLHLTMYKTTHTVTIPRPPVSSSVSYRTVGSVIPPFFLVRLLRVTNFYINPTGLFKKLIRLFSSVVLINVNSNKMNDSLLKLYTFLSNQSWYSII